jgi:hypothetical protein
MLSNRACRRAGRGSTLIEARTDDMQEIYH